MAGDKEVFLEILKKRLGLPEAEFGELEKIQGFKGFLKMRSRHLDTLL